MKIFFKNVKYFLKEKEKLSRQKKSFRERKIGESKKSFRERKIVTSKKVFQKKFLFFFFSFTKWI